MIREEEYLISGHPDEMKWLHAYADSLHKHIDAVQEAGKRLGVPPLQLSYHDNSKFDTEEFPHYARQWHGDAGDPDGFARAWLRHLHKNPHHWEYYIFPSGYTPKGSTVENGVVEMPENYALEMVADWMGASIVYTGSDDMSDWLQKNASRIVLHSKTSLFVEKILGELGYGNIFFTTRETHEKKD